MQGGKMRRYVSCWFVLLIAIGGDEGYAQSATFAFEHYTIAEGLPTNSILSLLQDHEGYLWIGTNNGLVRYDGYEFQLFKPDPTDSTSIADRRIYALFEDRNQSVWVGTHAGLSRYDRANGHFESFRQNPENPNSLQGDLVRALAEDSQGHLWVGTLGGGLHRFDPTSRSFTAFRQDASSSSHLADDQVLSLHVDEEGMIWIGTASGTLQRFNPETETFRTKPYDTSQEGGGQYPIYAIQEDVNGNLWIGTHYGLYQHHTSSDTWSVYRYEEGDSQSLSHDRVISILAGQAGYIWAGTAGTDERGGVNRINPRTGEVTRIMHDPDDEKSLSGVMVTALLEDHAGGLWVGTAYGGLNYRDWSAQQFSHYRRELGRTKLKNEVQAIWEDRQGEVWVGTWGEGLSRLNPQTNTWKQYGMSPNGAGSIRSSKISALLEDERGVLWVGTGDGGLYRYDRQQDDFVAYYTRNSALQDDRVVTLYQDLRGRLWIGTRQGGLHRYDAQADQLIPYTFASPIPGNHWIETIQESRLGELWVGTNGGGVGRLDEDAGTFTYFVNDPDLEGNLSHNSVLEVLEDQAGFLWFRTGVGSLDRYDARTQRFHAASNNSGPVTGITSILEDQQRRLWLGTKFEGLLAYDMQAGITAFSQDDPRTYDHMRTILEDQSGLLWISTERGFMRFDPTSETFKAYDMGQGLQTWETHKGHTGTLYFGGNDGIVAFHPAEMQDNPVPPRMVLTAFQIGRSSGRTADENTHGLPTYNLETVQLNHDQRDLSFEFTGLHFSRADQIQYAYQLENYDQEWQQVGTQQTATYTNLAPGTYIFRVKAANADGVWAEEGKTLSIDIRFPWWRTWWAYGLGIVGLLALIYGVTRWRVYYLAHRNRQLENLIQTRTVEIEQQKGQLADQADKLQVLDQLKSRFFANLSHEFRTPLTLIVGPLQQALAGNYGTLEPVMKRQMHLMLQQGRYLLQLINQLLDLAKLESGRMEVEREVYDLLPLLRAWIRSFSSLAEQKQITLQCVTRNPSLTVYCDRDKIGKIVNNLVGNAIKFAPERGWVHIDLQTHQEGEKTWLVLQVQDNGAGIPEEHIPHIFDRFYQAEDANLSGVAGTGIGLALCKELAELLGGTLKAESTPGNGSIFTLRIPAQPVQEEPFVEINDHVALWNQEHEPDKGQHIALQDGSAHESLADPVPQEHSAKRARLLVVEDHPDVRAFIKDCLAQDYEVLEASHGEEGLAMAREHLPDLIISDVRMPRMDGFALCQAIKKDETVNHIPVILLTARASDQSKVDGLRGGADAYLNKPFHVDALQAQVEGLIQTRKVLRNRFSREVTLQPTDITVPAADAVLLEQVQSVIETHMADANFSSEQLAYEVGLSLRQLNRKLNDLIEMPSSHLIRTMRLERSAQLLAQQAGTVSEIAYAVGFNSPSYFARLFREHFGVLPSAYTTDQT